MIRAVPAILALAALASCRSQPAQESLANASARQAEQLQNQARALQSQAENSTGAIERAMENETRVLFDRREALLNGAIDAANAIDDTPPPPPAGSGTAPRR